SCRRSGACASRFLCLWTVQRWTGTPSQTAAIAFSSPGAPSTMRNSGAQTPPDEIVEHRTPGFSAFAAHALDREQHFLAVGAHTDDNEQRDGGCLAVEPHAHHGAVENDAHDRFLAQRAGIPRIPVALHLAP